MKHWIGALCIGCVPIPASARIIDITLSGHVTYLSGVALTKFSFGESASARLTFDTAAPGGYIYGGTVYKYYPSAGGSGSSIKIGSYGVSIPTSRIFVTNNESGSYDRFIIDSYAPIAAPIAGLEIRDLFFNWQAFASYTNSTDIPDTIEKINGYGLPEAAIDYGSENTAANRVQLHFDSVKPTAVPEPTTWALMIGGFGLVGGAVRRFGGQSSPATV